MNQKIRLGVIVMITLGTGTIFLQEQSTSGLVLPANSNRNAPIATSGDNIYIAWWANKTGNNEVMFRASNDGGATFAKKINLSNTTGAESEDASIAASGKNVFVTWWERNQTANTPVMKISTDNGKSFGPMLKLASNDTISNSK
jgi:hypothetical protein